MTLGTLPHYQLPLPRFFANFILPSLAACLGCSAAGSQLPLTLLLRRGALWHAGKGVRRVDVRCWDGRDVKRAAGL